MSAEEHQNRLSVLIMSAEEARQRPNRHSFHHRHPSKPRRSFSEPSPLFPVSSSFRSPVSDTKPNQKKSNNSVFSPLFRHRRGKDYGGAGEPSSPKVSCIGQVKAIKNKKKQKQKKGTGCWREMFLIFGTSGTDAAVSPMSASSRSSLHQKGDRRKHNRSVSTGKEDGDEGFSYVTQAKNHGHAAAKDPSSADQTKFHGEKPSSVVKHEMQTFQQRSAYEGLPPLHHKASRNSHLLISDDIFPETWLWRTEATPGGESKLVSIVPQMGTDKEPEKASEGNANQHNNSNSNRKVIFRNESVHTDCMRCSKTSSIHGKREGTGSESMKGTERRMKQETMLNKQRLSPMPVKSGPDLAGFVLPQLLQRRLCSRYDC